MTVLVFHLGSLGDTIVTIPLLRAVRAAWPGARVVMLHNAASLRDLATPPDILAATGLVDEFREYQRHLSGVATARELFRTWRTIRRIDADIAVFAGPSIRASTALRRDRLFLRASGVTHVVGFHPCAAAATERGGPTTHEAVRKLQRLAVDGVDISSPDLLKTPLITPAPDAIVRAAAWCRQHGANLQRMVAVGPGSLMQAKAWPFDRFIDIGRQLLGRDLVPVVIGGPSETAEGDRLIAAWGGGLNAAGAFSVQESAALLSLCRLYVGIDSGAAHLAAAVGRRCVVLMSGRMPEGMWDPLGQGHIVLRHRTSCECCGLFVCTVDGHPCMRGLSSTMAADAIASVLDQGDR